MKTRSRNLVCHLLDHRWCVHESGSWAVCHRCGEHEYWYGVQSLPTIPQQLRQLIHVRITWPLTALWNRSWIRKAYVRLFACEQCGSLSCKGKDCDGIPF